MGIWLTTRERVRGSLDSDHTAYRASQVDRAIDAASRAIELGLHWANIHPVVATRYFPWPNQQSARPWRLYLENQGLISLTSLTSGGDTIGAADYFLEPVNEGPPFQWIEIDLGSSASFTSGSTHQRSVAAAGLWGYRNDETPAGALAEALDTTETEVDVTNGALVGIGSLLRVDNERLNVTGRAWMDSTHNLAGDMTADRSDTLLAVSGGSWFEGEPVMVGTEEMAVKAVTGSNLTVQRATNGTVLAEHTGSVDLFVPRRLTVERAAAGTTAANHDTAAALVSWVPPPLIEALAVAVAMDQVEQELGAYSRTTRSGDAQADAPGDDLGKAWNRAIRAHGRFRTDAV
jgi:hypothetical protein